MLLCCILEVRMKFWEVLLNHCLDCFKICFLDNLLDTKTIIIILLNRVEYCLIVALLASFRWFQCDFQEYKLFSLLSNTTSPPPKKSLYYSFLHLVLTPTELFNEIDLRTDHLKQTSNIFLIGEFLFYVREPDLLSQWLWTLSLSWDWQFYITSD